MPRRKLFISRKAEVQVLVSIIAITIIPVIGTIGVVVASSRPNLEELVPIQNSVGNYLVLNWSVLLREPSRPERFFAGEPVRALGYMFEGDRSVHEGDLVQDFVLLPDAGNLLHPAHRFGDQMIAVHLEPAARVPFSCRALVWVWGKLRSSQGDPSASKPLYSLEQARVQRTDETVIAKYFK